MPLLLSWVGTHCAFGQIVIFDRADRLRWVGDARHARIDAAVQLVRRQGQFATRLIGRCADVLVVSNDDLAVRFARPRGIACRGAGRLRRGQIARRRNHQRRTLAVVDARAPNVDPHAAEDVLDDFLFERVLVVLGLLCERRGGKRKQRPTNTGHEKPTQACSGSLVTHGNHPSCRFNAAVSRDLRRPARCHFGHPSGGIRALLRRELLQRSHTRVRRPRQRWLHPPG